MSKRKERNMNTFEKILEVLAKNIGITIVLILSIVLFAWFSDGLISGLITAASALLAFTSGEMLYKEFKKPAKKSSKKK